MASDRNRGNDECNKYFERIYNLACASCLAIGHPLAAITIIMYQLQIDHSIWRQKKSEKKNVRRPYLYLYLFYRQTGTLFVVRKNEPANVYTNLKDMGTMK